MEILGLGVTSYDLGRNYAGSAPGQDPAAVIARLTRGDLALIVGARVTAMLSTNLSPASDGLSLLAAAALRALEENPLELLARAEIRSALVRNFDSGKIEELQMRLSSTRGASPKLKETLINAHTLRALTEFLGFEDTDSLETSGTYRPSIERVAPAYGLFPHQRAVAIRAYTRVARGSGRAVVHMPTGAGKTRTAMHVVCRMLTSRDPCLVIWLAASRELLDQAAEAFQSAWAHLGDRPVGLHRFWADYSIDFDDGVEEGLVVAGLAKMQAYRARQPNPFLRLAARTNLVVMDEAHQAVAPTYRGLIEALAETGPDNAVLGLTATPGRSWSDIARDEELVDVFGGSKIALEVPGYSNPVNYLLENGYLARPKFELIRYRPSTSITSAAISLADGDDYDDEILSRIAADDSRNCAVLAETLDLIARGHSRIILFAASVGHARDLAAAFFGRGVDARVVSSGMPQSRRAATLRAFRRLGERPMVLCNFGVLTTGFDAPLTSAAVIARPTRSLVLYSQMVGRATRGPAAGGNATCEIRTVIDPAYPGYGDVAEAFFNWEDVWSESGKHEHS